MTVECPASCLLGARGGHLAAYAGCLAKVEEEYYVERIHEWDERRDGYTKIDAAKTTIAFVAAEVTKEKK
jgi:hypothetical protein